MVFFLTNLPSLPSSPLPIRVCLTERRDQNLRHERTLSCYSEVLSVLLFFCMLFIVNPCDSHRSLLASGSQSLSWLFSCYFSDALVIGRSFAWWLVAVIMHLKLLREYSAFSLVAQSCPTLCELMDCNTRLPCPSPTPRACSNSCPSSWWCHPTITSSVVPFSSCLQSFPVSGSFSNESILYMTNFFTQPAPPHKFIL